jgi:hypothetical protein
VSPPNSTLVVTPPPGANSEPGCQAVTTIPSAPSAIPMPWIGDGISPKTSPTITGTTGAVAATGATMLITPTDSPR